MKTIIAAFFLISFLPLKSQALTGKVDPENNIFLAKYALSQSLYEKTLEFSQAKDGYGFENRTADQSVLRALSFLLLREPYRLHNLWQWMKKNKSVFRVSSATIYKNSRWGEEIIL